MQLEISQREACKVIRALCDELSTLSNISIPPTQESSDDLLPAVLMLGNISKRICYDKLDFEAKWQAVKAELTNLEARKTAEVWSLLRFIY